VDDVDEWDIMEGTFATNPVSVTWTASGDTNREFLVRGWYDCNKNKVYDSDEPHRMLYVTILKVDFECVDDWGQWLPEGGPGANDGNEIRFKATISPPSAEGLIRFNLQDTTAYKGYCVNAPSNVPATGLHSGSWEDLKFTNASSSAEWTIESNGQQATTTGICSTATVVIKSFDYAAWGRLSCKVQLPGGAWCDATYVGTNLLAVTVPKDGFNGIMANKIGDAFEWDDWGDVTTDLDFDNTDGVASLPPGITANGYIGDGIQGAQKRLNPYKRDLFVVNSDSLDASHFDSASNLERHELALEEYEMNSGESPVVNLYRDPDKTCGKQYGVKLIDDGRKVLFWFYDYASGQGYYVVRRDSYSSSRVEGSSYIGINSGPGSLHTHPGDEKWFSATTLTNKFAYTITMSSPMSNIVAIEASGDTVGTGWTNATTATIVDASAGSIELEFAGNINTNKSYNICVKYAYGTANPSEDKHCRVFAISDADKKKLAVVHEMGHTVGLQHHSTGANTNGAKNCHMTYNANTTIFCPTMKSDPSDPTSPDLDAGRGACYYRILTKGN
jgi:hypothetical protein